MPILGTIASSTRQGQNVDTGAMFALQVITVGAPVSSISFTNIPSTYKHLQIRWIARTDRANNLDGLKINFNGDTSALYTLHNVFGDGANTGVNAAANLTYGFLGNTSGNTKTSGIYGSGVTDILSYANTNMFKTVRTLSGDDGNSGTTYGYVSLNSSVWRSTNAITSLTIDQESGSNFLQYSEFGLYGVK